MDSALLEGLEISSSYDPMISKVIAWGADRTAALDTLDAALAGYTALGIDTNVEYLRLLINDDDVRAGRLDTGLIERKMPDFTFRRVGDAELVAAALYAVASGNRTARSATVRSVAGQQRLAARGAGAPAGQPGNARRRHRNSAVSQAAWPAGTGHVVAVDGGPERDGVAGARLPPAGGADPRRRSHRVLAGPGGAGSRQLRARSNAAPGGPTELFLGNGGWSCRLEVLTRESRLARVLAAIQREEGTADPEVRSPMPGTVVSVAVSNGDTVAAGQVLLSVEAMKMEHQLVAEVAGTVHISVTAGRPGQGGPGPGHHPRRRPPTEGPDTSRTAPCHRHHRNTGEGA